MLVLIMYTSILYEIHFSFDFDLGRMVVLTLMLSINLLVMFVIRCCCGISPQEKESFSLFIKLVKASRRVAP